MPDMFTMERLEEIKGKEVRSADGEKIGTVHEVFYDEVTNQPEWIGLGTGFLGMKHAIVPIDGATIEGDCVCVPYEKDVVKNEPSIDDKQGYLTPESERELCEYFGLTETTGNHRHARYDFSGPARF